MPKIKDAGIGDKIAFVTGLIDSHKETILDRMRDKADQFPEYWNGYELREYVGDSFKRLWTPLSWQGKRLARYKNYKNHCLVNNLIV